MRKEKIIVTSALPYANGPIHLGHLAGAYLPADIFVRYKRLRGADIIYICGTDEHGVPITIEAEKKGISPKDIVDKYYKIHKESFEKFGIKFDNFSRTTLKIHYETSQDFFLKLYEKGFLKKKRTKQLYCPKCKRFLADRFVEGICPYCKKKGARGDQCENCGKWLEQTKILEPKCKICLTTPIIKETYHWYIPLGNFQEKIKNWILSKKGWRENVINFCLGWFNEGLEDRAVTRDLEWGVPVPLEEAKGKVLYVWFDAPIGYISSTKEWAIKNGTPDRWKEYWKNPDAKLYHFIGKDNIVFHAIFFPIMLMGYGEFNLPDNVIANEFLNLEGQKISTSRNFAVWLDDYLSKFPPDPLRYALTTILPETRDTDFSWKYFQERNNSELADILGNFINRTLSFVKVNYDGVVPLPGEFNENDREILDRIYTFLDNSGRMIENFEFRKAILEVMNIARLANKYFNDEQPWKTIKGNPERCRTTIYLCLEITRVLALAIYSFMPFSSGKILKMLNLDKWKDKLNWTEFLNEKLRGGHKLGEPFILFKKIEDKDIIPEIKKLEGVLDMSEKKEEKPEPELIDINEFMKVDLRVARVLKAERVPKTDKLLKMEVDDGKGKRQVIAGISEQYSPEDMVGKNIVIVANLKPATIRGIQSNGMLLAAVSDDDLSLITVEKDIPAGSRVR
ncbi:methionine--tRNA ligase [candidate division KSB1 bacterium]|nr:MAG: methionine--tRNA ligase [candidate division KSB1 bacterium]